MTNLRELRFIDEPRNWSRPWMDPPGKLPCKCCGGGIGYTAGGSFGAQLASTDKTDFAAETTAAVTTANLSQARSQYPAGTVNPGVAGYFLGGLTATGVVATADKLIFSSDITSAATTANLANNQANQAAISERSTKAYIAGGITATPTSGNITANAHKLTFAGDSTAAQTTANLSVARYMATSVTEGSTKGYWFGGNTAVGSGVRVATADMITFSSDATAAQTSANLSVARELMQSVSDGATFGYMMGGASNPSGGATGLVDRITFSTDATAARTSMSLTRSSGAGMSDGIAAIIGGFDGTTFNKLSKLTFSTEAITTLGSPGNLSASKTLFGMACTVGL